MDHSSLGTAPARSAELYLRRIVAGHAEKCEVVDEAPGVRIVFADGGSCAVTAEPQALLFSASAGDVDRLEHVKRMLEEQVAGMDESIAISWDDR